jgi:hypothetical protein
MALALKLALLLLLAAGGYFAYTTLVKTVAACTPKSMTTPTEGTPTTMTLAAGAAAFMPLPEEPTAYTLATDPTSARAAIKAAMRWLPTKMAYCVCGGTSVKLAACDTADALTWVDDAFGAPQNGAVTGGGVLFVNTGTAAVAVTVTLKATP